MFLIRIIAAAVVAVAQALLLDAHALAVTDANSIIIDVDVPLTQVISVGRIWVRAPAVLNVPGVRAELFVASVLLLSCAAFLLMMRWP